MLQSFVFLATMGLLPKLPAPVPVATTIVARDGVAIAANVYANASPTAPVILLFHEAGSNKDEYDSIAPRLVLAGYAAIAIDQRSGGDLFGSTNATVARRGHEAPYLEVVRDMDATLAYARRAFPHARVYAWGSSYSAALVFAFAARHPHEIAAVLAFSPGEYFANKQFVRSAARRVRVPVFVDSAADPQEERAAHEIAAAVRAKIVVDYVPRAGVHGSATLRDDADSAGAAENWDAVMAFLERVRSGSS